MSQQNRHSPSYFDFCVQQGIPKEEILMIHGDVGDEEKLSYFKNLDQHVTNCKVLICTTAVAVGIDIGVHFGKIFVHTCRTAGVVRDLMQIFVHTCRTAGVVRDLMQLIPRVGRFDGGLTDKLTILVAPATPIRLVAAVLAPACCSGTILGPAYAT